jgi:hypothetical protein
LEIVSLYRYSSPSESLERAIIQYDWCPYKKGKFGYRHTTKRPCEDTGRMPKKLPKARRKSQINSPVQTSEGTRPCAHFDLRLSTSRTEREQFLWFQIQPPESNRNSNILYGKFPKMRLVCFSFENQIRDFFVLF